MPKTYTAITLGPLTLYRFDKASFITRNHESIHR